MNVRKLAVRTVVTLFTVGCSFAFAVAPALAEGTLGLPDSRGYEMVTPVEDQDAELYAPFGAGKEGEEAIPTVRPVRAAADGHAVTYVGEPTSGGNGSEGSGNGNEYMATRGPGGWTQLDIQPPGYASPVYSWFSDDLSTGVLESDEALLPAVSDKYPVLYARASSDGSLHPLFDVTPPNREPGRFGAATVEGKVSSLATFYAGASSDFKHVLFAANDALTSDAVDGGQEVNNLYDSVEGSLRLVNVLPDGSTQPNAVFGAPPAQTSEPSSVDRAISADGSRIFWTDLSTEALYVRENDTTTKLIAEGVTYLTASTDGSKVIYAKAGDLYEDDLSTGVTSDLAPGAEVLGIAGAGEDVEYVYFVARGRLAAAATSGEPNLYLLHGGVITFIATLTSEDSVGEFFGNGSFDDWESLLGRRTAEATPDGHSLVFMTKASPTGYENRKDSEVYVYNSVASQLICVSCNPTGAPPATEGLPDGYLPISMSTGTYQLRVISADGSRVFFGTPQPLVPQDTNKRTDVYEWERDGSSSCQQTTGCIYLLSGGSSQSPSYLLDASANGNDVFVITRAHLVAQDQNELYDLYDVRVGVEQVSSPPQCTGTGCQGLPAAPPVFATPSSVTFSGVGNFLTPGATGKAKPKAKSKVRHKRKAHKAQRVKGRKGKGKKSNSVGRALRTSKISKGRGAR